jgi:Single-strand binding protein family
MERQDRYVDIRTLEEYFAADLELCYDPLAGEGVVIEHVSSPPGRSLTVQVFPDTSIARIRTPLADVTLRSARIALDADNDALFITGENEVEWTRATIDRTSTLVFATVPKGAQHTGASWPTAGELSEGSTSGRETEIARSDTDRSRTHSSVPESEPTTRIEQERVNLTGRIGMEPRFRTTKNDKLVCSFPLAVHEEDGATRWHNVAVFGERALRLQGELAKGQEVEVVGYVHVQQVSGKDGTPKEKREVWAAVVRKPKKQE